MDSAKVFGDEQEQPDDSSNSQQWQILEGLKDGQRFEDRPPRFGGYILKRRKRPLKGWHKRYVQLQDGILSYGKSAADVAKGKLHGSVDIGLSVISYKSSSRRIDIDSDTSIYHFKTKKEDFHRWLDALRVHRLARQHAINYGTASRSGPLSDADESDNRDSIRPGGSGGGPGSKLSSMSLDSASNNQDNPPPQSQQRSVTKLQEKLVALSSLLKMIETAASANAVVSSQHSVDLEGFKYKRFRPRFHLRRKKHPAKPNQKTLASQNRALSVSHQSLAMGELSAPATVRAGGGGCPVAKQTALADFVALANEINNDFRQLLKSVQEEQRRSGGPLDRTNETVVGKPLSSSSSVNRSHSIDDASALSISEYHDAMETVYRHSDYRSSSSSLSSSSLLSAVEAAATAAPAVDDEDESVTDFSEDGSHYGHPPVLVTVAQSETSKMIRRRTRLPAPAPTNDISLWSLLYKNIGRDLSKISMPVTINEPLNLLQRLCEELEYCELLDMAAAVEDPCQRMLLVAAFAISAYSSSYFRVGHKPFNPLLGETYECMREDKGFRFVAEQVSHHPPVSACHADSDNYVFWQDMRVKTKFWGKSMEIIPIGTVNVTLKKPYETHYRWNKVTTCVHNLFKGERYVDVYGELNIEQADGGLGCLVTFKRPGYWSGSASNEIQGTIANRDGQVLERLHGKWNESVHSGSRCIWRAGTMPDGYEAYYGFTRFAIELNELTETERPWLPPTDTRFRPDQRLLEEGRVEQAEQIKLELEQRQRERRKQREAASLPEFVPLWFEKHADSADGEVYLTNQRYWDSRRARFPGVKFPELWPRETSHA